MERHSPFILVNDKDIIVSIHGCVLKLLNCLIHSQPDLEQILVFAQQVRGSVMKETNVCSTHHKQGVHTC